MSLRKKFYIYFLLISLIPLMISEYVSHEISEKATTDWIVNEMQALTDIQEKRINEVLYGYLEQVRYISIQTDLSRAILQAPKFIQSTPYSASGDVLSILMKQTAMFPNISAVSVVDMQGRVISSTDGSRIGSDVSGNPSYISGKKLRILSEIFKDSSNQLQVRLFGPITGNSTETIGVLEIIASSGPIIAITEDYTGLGKTGEVSLVKKNVAGDTLFLTPLRFDSSAALSLAIPKENSQLPEVAASSGIEKVFKNVEDVDYNGRQVIAVTRFVDALGWGVVAKIDRAEALSVVTTLTRTFAIITLVVVLIIVLIAYILARSVSLPILQLAKFAHVIQSGNFEKSVSISADGEVGYLASTLNTMAKTLRDVYKGLEEKVAERTYELEKSKNRLAVATEAAHIGVWEWDVIGNVVSWDEQMFLLYGINKDIFSLQFQSWIRLIHSEDKSAIEDAFQQALMGKKKFDVQFRIVCPNGELKHIQAHAIVLRDTAQKPKTMIGVNWDITQEAQIDLMKSDFISLASHQLRTPLTAVRWFTELLEGQQDISETQRKLIKNISSSTARMIDLVKTLLNISRIQSGRISINPELVNIEQLVTSLLHELTPQYGKDHTVHVSISDDIEYVNVDKRLLHHVYMNLLTNALKYSPPGKDVFVRIYTKGNHIESEIQDFGYGIPISEQSRIFERFFRADNILKSQPDGSGLGLYLVKLIADAMSGTVRFVSEEAKGSTFWFSFPKSGIAPKKGVVSLE